MSPLASDVLFSYHPWPWLRYIQYVASGPRCVPLAISALALDVLSLKCHSWTQIHCPQMSHPRNVTPGPGCVVPNLDMSPPCLDSCGSVCSMLMLWLFQGEVETYTDVFEDDVKCMSDTPTASHINYQSAVTSGLHDDCEDNKPVSGPEIPAVPLTHECRRKYSCDYCGRLIVLKTNLIQHIRIHGRKLFVAKIRSGKSATERSASFMCNNSYATNYLICETCGKSFNSESELVMHSGSHIGECSFNFTVCKKPFTKKKDLQNTYQETSLQLRGVQQIICSEKLPRYIRMHTGERPYNCKLCTKSFKWLSNLIVHNGKHSGERPFCCKLCNKSFSQKYYLVVHNGVHTGEHPYSCKLCPKSFKWRASLVMHNVTHDWKHSLICELCCKHFSRKIDLVVHNRVHTGERPYNCKRCLKSFKSRSGLFNHNATHTGERPFSCEQCNKSFPRKSSLSKHCRTHTGERPFTCTVCSKSFLQKGDLTIHKRTHTGEHPFCCKICNKLFVQKGQLVVHTRMHTGEQPFSCGVCDKSFYYKSTLAAISAGTELETLPAMPSSEAAVWHYQVNTRPAAADNVASLHMAA
ncbi:hypothetical protein PR048_020664 [Dryococelus australis]|uniref:C2H2-type domain-containing protein n=1 Tax=Dryococelus australis TaxID=614101 RepID=A0ABQ9H6Y9_9NEOP|nr:hypothetical protein PR048_020664 [Dryococelus australis]